MPKILTFALLTSFITTAASAQDVKPFWEDSETTQSKTEETTVPAVPDVKLKTQDERPNVFVAATAGYQIISDLLIAEEGQAEYFDHGATVDLMIGFRFNPKAKLDFFFAYAPSAIFRNFVMHRHELAIGMRINSLTVALGAGINVTHAAGATARGVSFHASLLYRTKSGFSLGIPLGFDFLFGEYLVERIGLSFGYSSK